MISSSARRNLDQTVDNTRGLDCVDSRSTAECPQCAGLPRTQGNRRVRRRPRAAAISVFFVAVASLATPGLSTSQSTQGASSAMVFEVASVRKSLSGNPPSSRFPLGSGDAYLPGGVFSARNQLLITYLRF